MRIPAFWQYNSLDDFTFKNVLDKIAAWGLASNISVRNGRLQGTLSFILQSGFVGKKLSAQEGFDH
jgi:hypothetical protein